MPFNHGGHPHPLKRQRFYPYHAGLEPKILRLGKGHLWRKSHRNLDSRAWAHPAIQIEKQALGADILGLGGELERNARNPHRGGYLHGKAAQGAPILRIVENRLPEEHLNFSDSKRRMKRSWPKPRGRAPRKQAL